MRPALFLDRDGIVNVDHGYVHRADQVEFISGIFDLVRLANQTGFVVVIVTNQAGIARGLYTEADFLALTSWMNSRFAEAGARIDAVYHCPHHPTEGLGALKQACECRKPAPGMFTRAMRDWSLSPPLSVLVGDKGSDLQAGLSAGVRNLFMLHHPDRETLPLALWPNTIAVSTLLDPRLTRLLTAGSSIEAGMPPDRSSDTSRVFPPSEPRREAS
jgi:D-glycero-D-manno-heptose 1,7-bisphosphate phosphatase